MKRFFLRISISLLIIALLCIPDFLRAQDMKIINQHVSKLQVNPHVSILDKTNRVYADKLVNESGFNTAALVAFGKVGHDTYRTKINNTYFSLVGSEIEMYYTNLVFLDKNYREALFCMFRQYAEEPEKRKEINEAIDTVKDVAQRRGITLNITSIRGEWEQSISKDILELGNKYLRPYASPGEVRTITAPIIRYYHEYGSKSTYENIIGMGLRLFDDINKDSRGRYVGFSKILASLNPELGHKIIMETEDRAYSKTPR